MGVMRVLLCFAMLSLSVPVWAAQTMLPARFGAWQAVAASAAPASPLSPADAALFRACHQKSVEQQVYQRNGETITVTLRRLGDPSYGYSAFSLLRPAPATDFRPTPHSSIGTSEAIMLEGDLLVDISGRNLAADGQDFASLATLLKAHASAEAYPTLWQYLPTPRLIPQSDRYALDTGTFQRALGEDAALGQWASGGWIGFEQDEAEAEVAQYGMAGRTATLVLLYYPTSALAADHVKTLGKLFHVNPETKPSDGKPVLYVRRTGSLVGLVSGAPSAAAAGGLLRQIRYQTVVTWNEPGFTFHQLTMVDYVVGAIYGTFAIMLITFVVGLSLGMIRIVVKHYIPGLVFDRHGSVEIIQLGLSSKPIRARDFY